MTIRSKPPMRPGGRDAVIRQWLLEQAKKGNLPTSAVGAGVPVFVKAVMTQEGPDIVVKCCAVSGANFYPLTMRINLPAFAAMLREKGIATDSVIGLATTVIGRSAWSYVSRPAKKAAKAAVNVAEALAKPLKAVAILATGPLQMAIFIAKGERIDKAILHGISEQLASVKAVAPYVQTVLSMVPGVGTGISAGLSAGLALASGQNITEAIIAASRAALPGGPLASAAFDVALSAVEGRPIATTLLAVLPISAQAKAALAAGLAAAGKIAKGENVAASILAEADQAMSLLPPDARKALQTGLALAQGKGLQAVKAAATGMLGPLPYVSPQTVLALTVAKSAVKVSQTASQIAETARRAQDVINQGKRAATLILQAKKPQPALLALVKKAVKVKATVKALAPALAIKAADSRKVQAAIANIAIKAKAGSPEAKVAAVSIVAAAKMADKISAARQAAAGGHAGFVVTQDGAIRRAPKGMFIQSSSLPLIETLYRGATAAPLRGSFTAVSGRHSLDIGPAWGTLFTDANVGASPGSIEHTPQWGGARDPGDEYEGPLYPARYNDPGAWPTYMADPHHTPNPVITPPIPEPGFPPLPDVVSGSWTKVGAYDSGATHTRTEVRSPTRTSTEVRSPTRTATEVRSPTSTSTDAYTQGNFTATVTGGAGAGATTVHIYAAPQPYTLDSRGPKQLAKSSMDVDTSYPTSDSGVGNTRNFLGLVAGNPKHFQGFVAGDAHGWGLGTVSGAGHWPLPGGDAAARKRVQAQLNLAKARHLLNKAKKRSKVGHMASLMVGRSSVSVGEDIPPELTESSDGLSDVDLIVQGADYRDVDMIVQGQNHQDMHDVDMIVQGLGLGDADLLVQGGVGCAEPNIAGFPSYLFTRARLSSPAIRRRFVHYLKSLPPKMRRRVGKRIRAAMLRTRIAGAIRGGYPAVGSHYGWTGVMGGIPGGYELVGSHRQPGILTP